MKFSERNNQGFGGFVSDSVLPAIPRATDFANASQSRKPLALYNPKHPAIELLQKIAKKVEALS